MEEIKERLAERFDEVVLLELLNVNSFDLVNRFEDLIENRIEYFAKQVEDTDDVADESENPED